MGGVRKAFLWTRIIRGVGRRKSVAGPFLQAHRFSQSAHLQVLHRAMFYMCHIIIDKYLSVIHICVA